MATTYYPLEFHIDTDVKVIGGSQDIAIMDCNVGIGIKSSIAAKLHVYRDTLESDPVVYFRQNSVYGTSSVADFYQGATNYSIARFYGDALTVQIHADGVQVESGKSLYIGDRSTNDSWRLSADSSAFKIGQRVSGSYGDSYFAVDSDGIQTGSSVESFDFIEVDEALTPSSANSTLKIKYNGKTYEIPAYIDKP